MADAPVADLVRGFNDAGFDLLREQPAGDDAVLSPLSIGHALLMARAAADDGTGAAIDAALALPPGIAAHDAWNALDQDIAASADVVSAAAGSGESTGEDSDDLVVAVADRVWPRVDAEPSQEWLDLLASRHGASVQPLDLRGDPSGSRDAINEWVADRTEDLIPELLQEGFIQPTTVLVLTDTVYFKARWSTVFGKYGPETGTFTRLDGSGVSVDFLVERELTDRRGTGEGYVGAEVPYVGEDFSMLVLVPDEGRFEEVRARLGQDLLDEAEAAFTPGPYELVLPPWETTAALDLTRWLTEIGAAPGSYPAISADARMSGAVHGADISVDEWGTVAAAATALGFDESAGEDPGFTVRADRPFLYVIRHRPTGAVLFTGQVTDPTA